MMVMGFRCKIVVSSYQNVSEITEDMDFKEKEKRLGEVITSFKCNIEELNALVNPGIPPEKDVEHTSTIEYFVM